MGRGVDDVAEELKLFPFRIAAGQRVGHQARVRATARLRLPKSPPRCCGSLKIMPKPRSARRYREAVITVPAYFNDAQRQATKDAGRLAGLEVLRLVNEPTAASLAYGLDKRNEGIIAVYDFGGGTFDISILRLHDGIFEVLATNGDTHLGGDDIDNLLLRIALEDVAVRVGQGSIAGHRRRAALAPRRDSRERGTVVRSRDAIELEYRGKRYARAINRELFERLIAPIVERTLEPCRACLADAKLTPEQIDEVVLVGGSTRIPLVRAAVERLFKAKPHTELNPDEVVALGAAVQAGILAGDVEDKLLLDVTPLSLGIETMGGVVSKLIHRNSTIPASATETFHDRRRRSAQRT